MMNHLLMLHILDSMLILEIILASKSWLVSLLVFDSDYPINYTDLDNYLPGIHKESSMMRRIHTADNLEEVNRIKLRCASKAWEVTTPLFWFRWVCRFSHWTLSYRIVAKLRPKQETKQLLKRAR
jgi:hypothetical protein